MNKLSVLLLGLALTLGLALAQDTGGMTGGGSTGGGMTGGGSTGGGMTGGGSTGGSETGGMTGGAGGQTIADIVSSDSQFSTLLDALNAAGLAEELSSGSFTVFAPTNEAFEALPSEELNAILNDLDQLANLLQNHVVSGVYPASEITGFSEVLMLNGQELSISTSGGSPMIGDATITETDIQASNGVIHVIDAVLLPSSMGSQTGGSATGGSETGGSMTGGMSETGGSMTGGETGGQ